VYSGLIGSPEIVEKGAFRSGEAPKVSRSHRSASVSPGRVAMAEVYPELDRLPTPEPVDSVTLVELWAAPGYTLWPG
jgi:hypothetical protein